MPPRERPLAAALRRLAAGDSTLDKLHLYSNNIGDDGARALAEALRHTAAPLRQLYVYSNNIRDDGARALADALRHTAAPLVAIFLYNNNIGDDGARALADALEDGDAWALDRAESRYLFRTIGAHASSRLCHYVQPGNRSLLTVSGIQGPHGARIDRLTASRRRR
jgi:hypothetical protein